MRITRPALVVPALVVLSMLITPLAALPIPEDGIAGTLEDYTAVNNGLPTIGEFLFCTVGDVNGDGFDDIAAAASNNSRRSDVLGLRVYTCKGGTSWEDNSSGLPTVDRFGGIGLGDVDEDGDLDLVAGIEFNEGSTESGITVWINNGTVNGKLSWVQGAQPTTSHKWMMVIFADINDDDHLDVVAGAHSRGLKVWTGNGGAGGTLQFTEMSTGLPSNGDYTGIDVADMNNDDDMDIVACDYGGGIEAHLYTGDGAGNWTSRDSSFPTGSEATLGIAAGDVDNDGNMDIVYGRRNNAVKCLLGNGGGTDGASFCWTAADTGLSTSYRYSQVTLADVDIDGDLDLMAACAGLGLQLYLGNGGAGGAMSWTLTTAGLPTSGHYYGAAFGDFNKDRVLDVFGSLIFRSNVGGLVAYKGTVTGASFPTATTVWEGTDVNETTINLGENISLDGRLSFDAEDAPDGDSTGANLTYEWNLTVTPLGSVMTDSDLVPSDSVASPNFTPDVVGNYTFTLAVLDTDAHWSIDEAFLELEVLKANEAPVADAGEDQTVETGTNVEVNGTASYDPDGELVGWQWNASISNPSVVALAGNNTTVATFTAPDVTGVYSFTLVVLDDNGTWSEEDEVNVTVELPPNLLPVAVATAPPAIQLGDTIELNGSPSYDPDGEIVEWVWNCTSNSSLPVSDGNAAAASATPEVPGTYTFTLTVRDDRDGWSEPAIVSVLVVAPEVNLPPVAVISGDPLVDWVVNDTLSLDGSGSSDADGAIVEYLWNCTSHPTLVFEGQNTTTLSFTPDEPGEYIITLAVRDDNGSWSLGEDTVAVTVRVPPPPPPPPNEPPVAVITGPEDPVMTGTAVALDGSSSYDEDGQVVDFGWRCTSHGGLEISGLNTSDISFIAFEETEYSIELRVLDDNGSWSDPTVFVVTAEEEVVEVNHPPTVSIQRPVTDEIESDGDGSFVVEWSGSDPDGDDHLFRIRILVGDDVIYTDGPFDYGVGGAFVWLDTDFLADATLVLEVTITEVGTEELLSTTNRSIPFTVIWTGVGPGPQPEPEPVSEEMSSGFPLLWVIIALAIAIPLIVVVVLLSVNREGQYPIPPPMGQAGAVPPGATLGQCPRCGGPIDYDNSFGQPYCPVCDKYL